ncbi:putative TPR repeat methyltransferase [Azospirillum fermentarium]|uniref:methyltransferase domain-containing protein n=1 Tax=Azospirillum fermentarium TaxID=1233114 RepID=UPI002226673A|nr:methyltransferase domain-containing protein [Azospirillum fermentarium]MCW2247070.1 putative TPR repeat methyltransferase [Azospirillum fermentarium]
MDSKHHAAGSAAARRAALLQDGFGHLAHGDPVAAAAVLEQAAALPPVPGDDDDAACLADACAGWGEALALAGDPAGAAAAYRRAITIEESAGGRARWAWRLAHAEALAAAGDGVAEAAFRALAAERPDSAPARLGLGAVLAAAGQTAAALDEVREAAFLAPGDPAVTAVLAGVLVDAGDALAAVELVEPARRRFGDDPALLVPLGRAWAALQEPDKARAALAAALEADPADARGAAAVLAALDGGDEGLNPAYVRALFDRYADRFDADLVTKLAYTGPALLHDALLRSAGAAGRAARWERALDLGCGTGLMAVPLRPAVGMLAGVDLAPRMVDKARARRLYDMLSVGDVVEAMEAQPGSWDLLTAADVLVYLGDLHPVMAAAARALRSGGWFAATVERRGGDGFALGPARRYAHADSHIRAAAGAAGLAVRLLEPCSSRQERRQPVPGTVFVVERV